MMQWPAFCFFTYKNCNIGKVAVVILIANRLFLTYI